MTLSKSTLTKMKKTELIDLVLQLQTNTTSNVDVLENKKLSFKRNFQNYSLMANGNRKYGFIVTGTHKTLTIKWSKYVPSGYSDNGIGGTFEVILSDSELSLIEKNGFTHSVLLPMIEAYCLANTNGTSIEVSDLIPA